MPNRIEGWVEPIAFYQKQADEVGEWPSSPTLFLPVTYGTLPFLRGAGAFWMDEKVWDGTEGEVEQALQTMAEQLGATAIEASGMGIQAIELDVIDGVLYYRVQIEGVWGDWLEAGPIPAGPEGPQGPAGPEGPEGPEGPQGWVHVGFYLPIVDQVTSGEMRFFRQWYCRDGAEVNTFHPEGPLEFVADITLPAGPEGPQGIQGIQGEDGPAGPTGNYYLITADNPDEQEDVVFFYRTLYSGTTHTALLEPELIGGAIAAQGPQGEEGPAGPAGPQGETGPAGPAGSAGASAIFVEYPNLAGDEFTRLSYLARRLVDIKLDQQLFHWTGAGFLMDFGSGMVLLEKAHFPTFSGIIFGPFVDWATSEIGRTEAAELLYCSMVPWRDFSDASLTAFYNHYGDYDWSIDYLAGNFAEMTRNWIANLLHPDYAKARFDMGILLGQYYYNPDFDYTELPCTPDIGTWSRSYDLTADDHGWSVNYANYGEYVVGEGFKPQNQGGSYFLLVDLLKGFAYSVTHCTFYATNVGPYTGSGFAGAYMGTGNGIAFGPDTRTGGLLSYSHSQVLGANARFYVQLNHVANDNARIVRVDLSGTGTPPD